MDDVFVCESEWHSPIDLLTGRKVDAAHRRPTVGTEVHVAVLVANSLALK